MDAERTYEEWLVLSEMDIEKPPDDAFEQERELVETDDEDVPERLDIPFDANEADAIEQERTVSEDDDDDYR
jgi:hypothetical protein